jgi:hypothetical protein
MAISPDPTVPDVIYLDEQAVDDIFSFLGHGTVSEIVERVSSRTEEGEEVGFSKILVGKLRNRSVEGEETEFVRTLDPIGKLAMLQEALREDDMLYELESPVSDSVRDELERGNIVELDTSLLRTPIEELERTLESGLNFHSAFSGLVDLDIEEEEVERAEETQELISALSREGDILRARPGGGSPFDFVLSYSDEYFRNPGMGFPREGSEYTVLGQVTMKFNESDELSLINFVDLASNLVDNPRETRREVTSLKRKFASQASNITNRDVDISEFTISHPDIEMKPLAIYR